MKRFLVIPFLAVVLVYGLTGAGLCGEIDDLQAEAAAGDAEAQYQLGFRTWNGEGVTADPEAAVAWFRKAAEQGHAEAQSKLGVALFLGTGTPLDYKEAFAWFQKAADQGNAKGKFYQGLIHAFGKGVKRDPEKAFPLFKEAAEGGLDMAQDALGDAYYFGQGVKKDLEEAVVWFRKAAESGFAPAQFSLGNAYHFGNGVPQDQQEALKWYRKAAEQDSVEAQVILGNAYHFGNGVPRDQEEAVKWYLKAAELDDPVAQFSLGVSYWKGDGVPQDFEKSVDWFRQAADQDHPGAQFNLGVAFGTGTGVTASRLAAADWLYKSGLNYLAQDDLENAQEALDRMRSFSPNSALVKKLETAIDQGDEGASSLTPLDEDRLPSQTTGQGTGWVAPGGVVVTNWHVVKDASRFSVLLPDGSSMPAKVLAKDRVNDVAVLSVPWTTPPPGLPLAAGFAKPGAKVFTIGFPHAEIMGRAGKVTSGEVSSASGVLDDPRTYQVTVPLQAGNSGGPLLNMRGEVVGVVTSKLAAMEIFNFTGDLPQNVNYAIKVQYLLPLLEGNKPSPGATLLAAAESPIEELAERVKGSVFMVLAQGDESSPREGGSAQPGETGETRQIPPLTKPPSATAYQESAKGPVGVWYSPDDWEITDENTNEVAEFEWIDKKTGMRALLIVEKTPFEIPLESMAKVALKNCLAVDPKGTMTILGRTLINGKEMLLADLCGGLSGIRFAFHYAFFSEGGLAVQACCMSSPNPTKEQVRMFGDFLSGVEVK